MSVSRSIPQPPFVEFVAIAAATMSLMALAIDTMLPALPQMGRDFGVEDHNHLHAIIGAFFMGAGAGQLLFGTLSDWLGRRTVLLWGIGAYVVLSLLAVLIDNLSLMIGLRFVQGLAGACASVISRAIVRDRYSGDRMAKVMSIVHMAFLIVPALAPALGQVILLFAPWRFIFVGLAVIGLSALAWVWLRLPEPLPPERRRRPDLAHLKRVAFLLLTQPVSVFYTLASTFVISMMVTYLSLLPQIFEQVYPHPGWLAPVFALCAGAMGAGALLNARIVEKVGARAVSHYAQAAMAVIALVHVIVAMALPEPVWLFVLLQALTMACTSLSTSNFMSIAMEDFGHVAGTAASVQGVVTMVGGSLIGTFASSFWTGHLWLLPLSVLICAVLAMTMVTMAEKGRLFRAL